MSKDRFEDLAKFYEFMLGPLPWREEFKRTLQDTVTSEEVDLLFELPFSGSISRAKLEKKCQLPPTQIQTLLTRMASEGVVMIYTEGGTTVYERSNPIYMTEQQVRKAEATPRREFCARFFNTILKGEASIAAPTRTPYYRVLPVEATVTAQHGGRLLPINVPVPDPRAVLPIDIVSEMIRRDAQLIAVADCYCRLTKQLLGEGCHHSLQTCLVFNKVAESLVNHGTARRISLDEALEIVRQSEEEGLVHNVDNCEGEIASVCNCCPCCSVLLTSWQRGMTNADSPSRYEVAFDENLCQGCQTCVERCPTHARRVAGNQMIIDDNLCLGCGLCVTACDQGANRMVPRAQQARLPKTNKALWQQIGREALAGVAKERIVGVFRRS